MKFVEIYKLQDDSSQAVLATCSLIDNKIVCEGNEDFVKNLEIDGILDYTSEQRKRLFFSDGLKFLEQLPNNFKSGYLLVSEIKDD